MYYHVLVSFHTAYLQLFGHVFVNREAGCKDVSRRGEGKFALQKVLLQFQDKSLVLGITVILVLHVGARGVGSRSGSWSWSD